MQGDCRSWAGAPCAPAVFVPRFPGQCVRARPQQEEKSGVVWHQDSPHRNHAAVPRNEAPHVPQEGAREIPVNNFKQRGSQN